MICELIKPNGFSRPFEVRFDLLQSLFITSYIWAKLEQNSIKQCSEYTTYRRTYTSSKFFSYIIQSGSITKPSWLMVLIPGESSDIVTCIPARLSSWAIYKITSWKLGFKWNVYVKTSERTMLQKLFSSERMFNGLSNGKTNRGQHWDEI